MPDGASAVAIASLVFGADAASGGSLLGGRPSTPSPITPPGREDADAKALATANRRRAISQSGRQSTLLVDDTETPIGQQIPAGQIGRTTLLGG